MQPRPRISCLLASCVTWEVSQRFTASFVGTLLISSSPHVQKSILKLHVTLFSKTLCQKNIITFLYIYLYLCTKWRNLNFFPKERPEICLPQFAGWKEECHFCVMRHLAHLYLRVSVAISPDPRMHLLFPQLCGKSHDTKHWTLNPTPSHVTRIRFYRNLRYLGCYVDVPRRNANQKVRRVKNT